MPWEFHHGLLALVVSTGLFSSSLLLAQEQVRAGGDSVRLDLGLGQSLPGTDVLISVTLQAPDKVDVGSVDIRATFPNKQLSFVEAKKRASPAAVNEEITAAVEDDSTNPDKSILKVTIRMREEGTSIPNGDLADLVFRIDEKAPLKGTITVQNHSSGTNAKIPGEPLEGMIGTDGEIVVDDTPSVFSCFFYMH